MTIDKPAMIQGDGSLVRVRFLCRDMMQLRLRKRYDVVLLLSTSKWVHLQTLGELGCEYFVWRVTRVRKSRDGSGRSMGSIWFYVNVVCTVNVGWTELGCHGSHGWQIILGGGHGTPQTAILSGGPNGPNSANQTLSYAIYGYLWMDP